MPAFVVSTSIAGNASGGTTPSVDTSGSKLIVLVASNYAASGGVTVSDSKSNTWTQVTTRSDSFNTNRIFYCINPTVGSGHTFTVTGSAVYASLSVYAFSDSTGFTTGTSGTNAAAATGLTFASVTIPANSVLVCGQTYDSVQSGFSVVGGVTGADINYSSGARMGQSSAYKISTSSETSTYGFGSSTSNNRVGGYAIFVGTAGASGRLLKSNAMSGGFYDLVGGFSG